LLSYNCARNKQIIFKPYNEVFCIILYNVKGQVSNKKMVDYFGDDDWIDNDGVDEGT